MTAGILTRERSANELESCTISFPYPIWLYSFIYFCPNAWLQVNASLIKVEISIDGTSLMRISDNGVGMQDESLHQKIYGHIGMGLDSMSRRAIALGGSLVLTPLDPGTEIVLSIA